MKKVILTLSLALASLLAANAFAQSKGEADVEGSKAMPSAPATKAAKATAKAARKAEGKAVAKTAKSGDDQPATTAATGPTKIERQAAGAKRKSAGAKAAKEPKDVSGPSS